MFIFKSHEFLLFSGTDDDLSMLDDMSKASEKHKSKSSERRKNIHMNGTSEERQRKVVMNGHVDMLDTNMTSAEKKAIGKDKVVIQGI